MNILATEYSPLTKSLDIYVSGCKSPHCPGCFNPETWKFDQGKPCNKVCIQKLLNKIREFDLLIENVMIMGGEPLDQDQSELVGLLQALRKTRKATWVFTKYNFEQVPDVVKKKCDYLKCGRYDPTQKTDNNTQYGVQLASANQRVYRQGEDFYPETIQASA